MFDRFKLAEYIGMLEFKYNEDNVTDENGYVGQYYIVTGEGPTGDPQVIAYPPYVSTAYFFVNILPIVVPTYLIVFFCESCLFSLLLQYL